MFREKEKFLIRGPLGEINLSFLKKNFINISPLKGNSFQNLNNGSKIIFNIKKEFLIPFIKRLNELKWAFLMVGRLN